MVEFDPDRGHVVGHQVVVTVGDDRDPVALLEPPEDAGHLREGPEPAHRLDQGIPVAVARGDPVHPQRVLEGAPEDLTVRPVVLEHGVEAHGGKIAHQSRPVDAAGLQPPAEDGGGRAFEVEVDQRPVAVERHDLGHVRDPG